MPYVPIWDTGAMPSDGRRTLGRQRRLAVLGRLYMGNIIVEHLAIAIQPPDRYSTGCTLIGRKSVTTTRHAGKACLRAWPQEIERPYE